MYTYLYRCIYSQVRFLFQITNFTHYIYRSVEKQTYYKKNIRLTFSRFRAPIAKQSLVWHLMQVWQKKNLRSRPKTYNLFKKICNEINSFYCLNYLPIIAGHSAFPWKNFHDSIYNEMGLKTEMTDCRSFTTSEIKEKSVWRCSPSRSFYLKRFAGWPVKKTKFSGICVNIHYQTENIHGKSCTEGELFSQFLAFFWLIFSGLVKSLLAPWNSGTGY